VSSAASERAADELIPTPAQAAGRNLARGTSFLRDFGAFAAANVGYLVLSAVLAFLLPRLLTVETYGHYRMFILYSGFVGLLHLGFLDGLLIRWAADPEGLIAGEMVPAATFLGLLLGSIVLAFVLVAAAWVRGIWLWILLGTAAYALIYNGSALVQYALQARKMFAALSIYTIGLPAGLLCFVVVAYFVRKLNFFSLLSAYVLVYGFATVALWGLLHHRIRWHWPTWAEIWHSGKLHLGLGWSILVASSLANIALALDRVVLSARFSVRDFAIYSFAGNALALTYAMIVSLSRVVFPYLSDGVSDEELRRIYGLGEEAILVLWAGSLTVFFPIAWLILFWLPNYIPSLPLIRILLLATGFTTSIQVLHGAYFRIARKQDRFLIGAFVALGSAALLLLYGAVAKRLEWVAIAMVGSALAWWLVNELLLRDVIGHDAGRILRSLSLIVLCGAAFLFCASRQNLVLGCVAYVLWIVLVVEVFGRRVLRLAHAPVRRLLASIMPMDGLAADMGPQSQS